MFCAALLELAGLRRRTGLELGALGWLQDGSWRAACQEHMGVVGIKALSFVGRVINNKALRGLEIVAEEIQESSNEAHSIFARTMLLQGRSGRDLYALSSCPCLWMQ